MPALPTSSPTPTLPLLRFRVTASHVKHAVRRDSRRCMIANAIQDGLPWAQSIIVDSQCIRLSNPATQERLIYMTPPKVQQALLDFDDEKPVEPFTVNIRLGYVRAMRSKHRIKPLERARVKSKKPAKRYMPAILREHGIRLRRQADAATE